ncbi:MAG: hypothetical protein KKI09_16340 [Spirochaetes bacterium]|nr:hypothetical protein [Spirochaetota bacterium]MBU0956993.1 hypothetical protein [Spirochaetota bacterium]
MLDQSVLARCNLFGVLKNIEYLAEHDPESAAFLPERPLSIRFAVHGGPLATLRLNPAKADMLAGRHPATVVLGFASPEHFNRMVSGKANPIPLKGLHRLAYLTGPFGKLTKRLEGYLRPDEATLRDPERFRRSAEMTLYAAMFSLVEIANGDPQGRRSAARIPDGVLQVSVAGSVGVRIVARGGQLSATKGYDPDPRALLHFASLQAAADIFSGKLDTYTALATGDLEMRGYIPMIDNINPVLDLVAEYLK